MMRLVPPSPAAAGVPERTERLRRLLALIDARPLHTLPGRTAVGLCDALDAATVGIARATELPL